MDMEKVWLESIRAIKRNNQKENPKIAISYDMKL